ncbi:MAG TPA: efflux RND transporter periplasmic adaptor subunit [Polyangiaceae bacterium]|jgi:RND family efflux transporter MFP subunit
MTPPDGHDLGFDLPQPAAISRARVLVLGLVGVGVLGVAFAVAYLPRRADRAALVQATDVAGGALLRVDVMAPKQGSSDRALSLPGSVQPLEETTVYARASGYVRKWYADIGDKVTAGQLLAELDTPELDQELDQARAQLLQAQATLVQSKANRGLSQTNLQRYVKLAPSGVVSQADLEQRQAMAEVDEANVSVAQAAISAQQANMRRLTQLKSFARVTAPFGGTVTQRTIEVGSLVTSGNGQPMYKVAAMDPARVFVQVPQDVAGSVRVGVPAAVTLREYPGRSFGGTVARAAGELDPMTRTMNTEVRVPNGDGALLPGMYAQVALTLPSSHRVFEIPSTALMTDSHGSRVAVVDAASKIHLVKVVVERDTGPTVEVASGLAGTERVAKLASSQFVEDQLVDVAK